MTLRRKYEEKFFRGLSFLFTVIIVFVLLQIIWTIAKKGIPSLSWQIVSQEPKGGFYFGKEGGILNAIAGSFYLAVSATILSFVISLPVALFMNVYLMCLRNPPPLAVVVYCGLCRMFKFEHEQI